ncbi:hypothetical protein ScPMuIL_010235 [Solemya velum]
MAKGTTANPDRQPQYSKHCLYCQKKAKRFTDQSTIQRYFARFDERFFQFSDKELAKINTFFYEKKSEACRKYASLKSELEVYNEHTHKPSTMGLRRRRSYALFKDKEDKGVAHARKLHDLKLAFSEFYLSLILLQNYQMLNFTGFRKILKKHDKLMQTQRGMEWRQAHVETAPFYTNKEVDHLIKETEQSVIADLEGGNRQKAMKRLRVPPLGDQQNAWTTFRVGLFSGIFAVLIVVVIIAAFYSEHTQSWEPALRMYRGMFLIILDIFLLGINTYGWRSSGVNHVLIFEIDPRHHLSHQQLLELATSLSVLWSLSVLGYLFAEHLPLSPFAFPLALSGFLLLYLINPIKILHYSSRMWLLKVLFRILTAPFHHVGFADFWLADQLNSLVIVLLDLEFLICFYAFEVDWLGTDRKSSLCTKNVYGIRAVIGCLPAWFRFAQCLRRYRDTKLAFPHAVNAGNTQQLFEKIVYAYKAYYYFAMVEDFILRFTWSLNVSIGEGLFFHNEILTTLLASLEVFRRFVWNFFRLENEHLNNCGQFRAVRDISIAPIDSNDRAELEDMMDEEDGADSRRLEKRNLLGKPKKEKVWLGDEEQIEKIPWKFKGV